MHSEHIIAGRAVCHALALSDYVGFVSNPVRAGWFGWHCLWSVSLSSTLPGGLERFSISLDHTRKS